MAQLLQIKKAKIHGKGGKTQNLQRQATSAFKLALALHNLFKYEFNNKSFILNAPLVSCPIPVIRLLLHPPRADDWNWEQLTRGAFRINDFL